ncbi:hypothetical protein [Rubritalea tangerina]|uniref:hypothetical protein n=1 Tax=Rubritalea tangerina TaxID=430798 RepID=UPI003617304C
MRQILWKEALEFGRDNPDGIDFRCWIFKISERWDVSFDGVWEHTCFCAIEPEVREVRGGDVAHFEAWGHVARGIFYKSRYAGG